MQASLDDFRLELGSGSEVGMALALFTMMLAVALNLRPRSFKLLTETPKPYVVGLLCQLVLLPLLTLCLCIVIQPRPSIALGMILVSCCPGGNVSNMLVLLARGNSALSVALTATSSVAAAFVTPIAILFWSSLYPPTAELLDSISFDSWRFLLQTFTVLALPLFIGISINSYFPAIAKKLSPIFVGLGSGLLVLIIVVAMTRYWDSFLGFGTSLLALVVLHNASAFLVAYLVSLTAGLAIADRRTLTFEVGIQNSGLAIVIILAQLGGLGGAVAVAGLWGTWHIIAGFILVGCFRSRPIHP